MNIHFCFAYAANQHMYAEICDGTNDSIASAIVMLMWYDQMQNKTYHPIHRLIETALVQVLADGYLGHVDICDLILCGEVRRA